MGNGWFILSLHSCFCICESSLECASWLRDVPLYTLCRFVSNQFWMGTSLYPCDAFRLVSRGKPDFRPSIINLVSEYKISYRQGCIHHFRDYPLCGVARISSCSFSSHRMDCLSLFSGDTSDRLCHLSLQSSGSDLAIRLDRCARLGALEAPPGAGKYSYLDFWFTNSFRFIFSIS